MTIYDEEYEANRAALMAAGVPEKDMVGPVTARGWDGGVLVNAGDYDIPLLRRRLGFADDDGTEWLTTHPNGAGWSDMSDRDPKRLIAEHRRRASR